VRVFVTGGTGFAGSRTVPLLIEQGYQVRCLHRRTSDRSPLPQPEIEWVEGDLSDTQMLASAMRGVDVLVNIASLGFGHADSIVRAAQTARIRRGVFISSTAIFTRLNAQSKQIRLAAEQTIQASGLQYTVLRPTMIYGSPRDRNMWRLIRFMRISPLVPVLGDGTYLQQPVYVEDVARAILACLSHDQTIGRMYNIAGKYPLRYNEVIDTIARRLNRRMWKLHLPAGPIVAFMRSIEQAHIPFPIKSEQVLRLNENKSFSYEDAQADFGYGPLSFEEGISLELQNP